MISFVGMYACTMEFVLKKMTNDPYFYRSLPHPIITCEHYKADQCRFNSKSPLLRRFVLHVIASFIVYFLIEDNAFCKTGLSVMMNLRTERRLLLTISSLLYVPETRLTTVFY